MKDIQPNQPNQPNQPDQANPQTARGKELTKVTLGEATTKPEPRRAAPPPTAPLTPRQPITPSPQAQVSFFHPQSGGAMNQQVDALSQINPMLLRQILHQSKSNIMIADLDEKIIYLNENTTQTFQQVEAELASYIPGFKASQILGESIHRFHKDPEMIRRVLQHLRPGESHRAKINAGKLVFMFNATAQADEEGKKSHYAVEWENITEKESFANKAELLTSALEGSNQAVIMCDRDLVISWVNPATYKLFEENQKVFEQAFAGFNAKTIIGTCIDAFHKNPEHQRRLLSDPKNLPYQTTIQVGPLFFSLNISANLDSEGKYIGTTLNWANTTDLMQERNNSARLQSSLSGAAQAIINCNRDLVITYANPATEKMIQENLDEFRAAFPGFSLDHFVGSCIDRFHQHPEHQRKLLANADNLPYQADIQVGKLTFNLNVSAMRDAEGSYIGNTLEWSNVTATRSNETEVSRLWGLIETAKTNFMICDKDLVITYCNPAVLEMMRQYESELKKNLPQFSVDDLVGTCIDSYHVNPAHQRKILTNKANLPFQSELKLGKLEFGVNATALLDKEGNLIGNAVEWLDYNDRAIYSSEVDRLLTQVMEGNLKERGQVETVPKAFQPMVENINQIIEAIVFPLSEIQERLGEIALGDVEAFVTGDYKGDHAILKNSLNNTLESLRELAKASSQIAEGDLTVEVTPKSGVDAMGKAISQIVQNMNSLLGKVNRAVNQISDGSEQIASSSQSLAQGSTEQASSLEEVSASMTELASQTVANAENANQANSLADAGRSNAQTGDEQMKEMITAMSTIEESSQNISKIIKVIDEIAFQTNLLALNAAVEAARAGVHGKGFAVVANEVRSLAGRSAQAAKETTEMIEDSAKKVRQGIQIADKTAEALTEIVSNVGKVSDLVAEIAAASKEQAEGINQINTGLNQIEQVTQQNTANSEESAAAAEELAQQSGQLQELVSQFKLKEQNEEMELPSGLSPELIAMIQKMIHQQRGGQKAEYQPVARPQRISETSKKPKALPETPIKAGGDKVNSIHPADVISLEGDFGRY